MSEFPQPTKIDFYHTAIIPEFGTDNSPNLTSHRSITFFGPTMMKSSLKIMLRGTSRQ